MKKANDIFNVIKMVQQGFKIKDTITASLFSGLLGSLAMDALNLGFWKSGKSETLFGHIAGSVFVRPFRTNQRKNFLLGEISHLISGSAMAIPLNYILKLTGKDNYALKGAVYGSVVWEVVYGIGQKVGLFATKPHMTKTHYSMLFSHILYGLVTTQAMVAFSEQSAFPDIESKTTSQNTLNKTNQPYRTDTDYNTESSDAYEDYRKPSLFEFEG